MELNGFNAYDVDPSESREPIPAGWYKCLIVASEEKPTKALTGSYLQLEIQVVEGEHSNRKVWDRLNLNNPNSTAVEIAQRTLSSVCRSVGVMTPRVSGDLHDIPFMAKIAFKPADGAYSASNEVKEYAEADNVVQAAPAAAVGSSPPWKR